MRLPAAPVLLAALAIGCNAVIDWSELQKTPSSSEPEPDDDDDSSGSSGNGTSSGQSSGGTSGSPQRACDLTKPFAQPAKVAGVVSTASHETSPSLTADELTIFFQRTVGADGGNILMATRASRDAEWETVRELTELAQNGADYAPSVSGDGLTLFWTELLSGGSRREVIKIATRTTPNGPFGDVRVLDEVSNTARDDGTPFISPDGTELFFSSTRETDERQIFRSIRSQGEFGAPALVSELVSGSDANRHQALSADGLTLFFGSERAGGAGGSDVWTAKRSSKTSSFGDIARLPGPVNTDLHEWPSWVSADGCRLYYGVLGSGAGDIFVATRSP